MRKFLTWLWAFAQPKPPIPLGSTRILAAADNTRFLAQVYLLDSYSNLPCWHTIADSLRVTDAYEHDWTFRHLYCLSEEQAGRRINAYVSALGNGVRVIWSASP